MTSDQALWQIRHACDRGLARPLAVFFGGGVKTRLCEKVCTLTEKRNDISGSNRDLCVPNQRATVRE